MEPLIPLARAVAREASRLDVHQAVVHIDTELGAVVVEGVTDPGSRIRMRAALDRARLHVEAGDPGSVLIVYPS
jgi:hypothetical protein